MIRLMQCLTFLLSMGAASTTLALGIHWGRHITLDQSWGMLVMSLMSAVFMAAFFGIVEHEKQSSLNEQETPSPSTSMQQRRG